jgi:hypothetical protein
LHDCRCNRDRFTNCFCPIFSPANVLVLVAEMRMALSFMLRFAVRSFAVIGMPFAGLLMQSFFLMHTAGDWMPCSADGKQRLRPQTGPWPYLTRSFSDAGRWW